MMERTIPQWMGRSWQGLKDLQVPPRGLSRFNPSWKFSPMEPIHHRHPWQEEEEKLKIRFWKKNSSVIETKYNIVIKIQINSKRNKWFLIQLLINAPPIPVSDQCLPVTPPSLYSKNYNLYFGTTLWPVLPISFCAPPRWQSLGSEPSLAQTTTSVFYQHYPHMKSQTQPCSSFQDKKSSIPADSRIILFLTFLLERKTIPFWKGWALFSQWGGL